MDKPLIGIPTRYHEKSEYIGQIRHYLDAILWAGGLPLMIPTTGDREIIREYVTRVHGVLLPGSPTDIDPKHYGAAPLASLGELYPERDTTDFEILRHVEQEICGVAFGIKLTQTGEQEEERDRKNTSLNTRHVIISATCL